MSTPIALDAARAIIAAACRPLPPERVHLAQAHGRILRESATTQEDIPTFHRSAFDGYALRSTDAPGTLRLAMEIAAGASPIEPLQPGECARIFTGAPLPTGADAVAMQEHCRPSAHLIEIPATAPWQGVRRRGEDATLGTVLLHRGHHLGTVETSLLAQIGHTHPLVGQRPRILHIVTGSELVPPDETPGPGKIRDSNSALIAGLIAESGASLIASHRAGDDLPTLLAALAVEPDFAWDLLLISGGASVGDYDFGARALRELGFSIHFSQLNLRPGKPLIFATRGHQLAFVIPGNPLSHFVCWHVAIRAAIDILLTGETSLPLIPLSAAAKLPGNPRETWWPGRLDFHEGRAIATPLNWRSSGDITGISGVNLLIQIPAASPGIAAGEIVHALRV